MRELISLRAYGLAERGLVSAPNMAVGVPFNIGLTGFGMPGPPPTGTTSWAEPTPGRLAGSVREPGQ
jgi:hypothetical protein